ncbi:probable palmitoyltransferase ZDHHC11B isoform X2 [Sarcophilus harrisii]|uniref:probable palmitoyltransferase ZDHHC11B isoform X2 n=1 Tax=Sarcophilus harrisii TaxID=9305 RepID=UPI001301A417|nr:probable palmitoyltransferase ZDHHC11B isoform X2 [Sarcophilus harrisii]
MNTCLWWKSIEMSSCNRSLRRTAPEGITKTISPPSISRVNGWSLPLHSFQLIAWTAYVYMTVVGFGLFIPLLPFLWRNITYAAIGLLFGFHLIVHITAVTIDPADSNVRHKENYGGIMPILDRAKHKHVIQNQFCHLCEVTVGVKAKHCSACNKCIADFDHHCKWLNNCVGSRNYWFFFSSVASAVLGIIFLVLVLLYIFIQYFVNPEELRTDPQFKMFRKLSTFDYMTQGRQKQSTNLQIKISIPLKSTIINIETGQADEQKKTFIDQVSCAKRQRSSLSTAVSSSMCLGFNRDLSQACLSLTNADSINQCYKSSNLLKPENEAVVDKKEQTASSSEDSLNLEPVSSSEILPGPSKLESLVVLYNTGMTQEKTTAEDLSKVIQNQNSAPTTSEAPNQSPLNS